MLPKLATAAILAAQSSLLASAQEPVAIPTDCIRSTSSFESQRIDEATRNFDQTQSIANLLPIGFTPFEYTVCIDEAKDDRLVSLTFTYANESGTQRRTLPRVGPAGGTCAQVVLEDRSHVDDAFIVGDSDGVRAYATVSDAGTFTSYGKYQLETTDYKLFEVPSDELVIGFTGGTDSEGALVSLGLVIANEGCITEKVPGSDPDPNADPVDDNSNGDGTADPDSAADGSGEGDADSNPDGSGEVTDDSVDIATFSSDKDQTFATKEEGDTEKSKEVVTVVIIVVVIVIALVVMIVIAVHVGTKSKQAKINQVTVMGVEDKKPRSVAATANNSSSVPQDSEDDFPSGRGKVKDTERQLANTEL